MRARQAVGIGLALMFVFSFSTSISATVQKKVVVKGSILSLNMGKNSFLISDRRAGETRYWIVKRTTRTRIVISGKQVSFSRLRKGNLVQVNGQLTGTREVLAERIQVISHEAKTQPTVVLRPPPAQFPVPTLEGILRITAPPEIIQPANGSRVGSEFTIVGRTAPSAQVLIEVVPRYLIFDLPSANAEVTADARGVFAHTAQPLVRISGASYRINVKARLLGLESPTASITVTQR